MSKEADKPLDISPFENDVDRVLGQAITDKRFAALVLKETGFKSLEKLAQRIEKEREKKEAEQELIAKLRQLYTKHSGPIHDELSDNLE